MYTYPSRAERRDSAFYSEAEKGNFQKEGVILYHSEIRKLEKSGFRLSNCVNYDSERKLYSVTVSWATPYKDGVPHVVYSYIHGLVYACPKNAFNNFAQELFILAQKANIKKA